MLLLQRSLSSEGRGADMALSGRILCSLYSNIFTHFEYNSEYNASTLLTVSDAELVPQLTVSAQLRKCRYCVNSLVISSHDILILLFCQSIHGCAVSFHSNRFHNSTVEGFSTLRKIKFSNLYPVTPPRHPSD